MKSINSFFIIVGQIFTGIMVVQAIHFFITIGIGTYRFYSLPKEIREIKQQQAQEIAKNYQKIIFPVMGGTPLFNKN